MSKINVHPDHMRRSGGKLADFGGKLAAGGQRLESAGQQLLSHASGDRSGFGSVISKAFGRGMQVAGKVFGEGGRVVEGAGQRLHTTANLHEEADRHGAGLLNRLHPDSSKAPHPHGGGNSPSRHGGSQPGKPGRSPGRIRGAIDSAKGKARDFASGVRGKLGRALGDPVDMATGEVIFAQLDLELPGALPLVLERTHLSNHRTGHWFGRSWTSVLDQRVEIDEDGLWFASADGMLLSYPTPVPAGSVLPQEGPRWPLTMTPDGGYTITRPDTGHTLHFGPTTMSSPLVAIADRNGNRIDFEHDTTGALTGIHHSGGYRVRVDTSDDRITALHLHDPATDTHIPVVRFGYDDAGDLTEVVNSSDLPFRFDYDSAGRMVRWEDRRGCWYEFSYDAAGRCVRGHGADGFLDSTFAYDPDQQVTTHTNSLGATTTFHLNEAGQVVRRTDPLGRATTTEWDRYDRKLAETDPLGRTTRFTHDDNGDLVAVTRPDGSQALAEFDADHQPTTLVDPDGAVWRRTYDDNGNLTTLTDPSGATTRFAHDDHGCPAEVTDPLGNTTRITTNPAGLPITVTDPVGATTSYGYTAFGRVAMITDPMGGVIRLEWTVEGKLAARTHADGSTETWRYDGENNLVEHTDTTGGVSRAEVTHFDLRTAHVAADGARIGYSYDTELRLTAITNAQGLIWRYHYDIAGNLVGETDFNNRTLAYSHDDAEQLVARTNGAGQTTRFGYDVLGNLVEQRSDTGLTRFAYDPAGRMVRAVNADADVVFQRDALGRTVAESCNGKVVGSTFDLLGRRIARRTPQGVASTWEFNGNDRPTALHTAGHTTRFGYDSAGREVERHFAAGHLAQSWDQTHRLRTQAITTTAAPATRGQQLVQRRSYRYRTDGCPTSIVDQIGGPREFDLDPVGQVTAVRTGDQVERYSYDHAGNITHADAPIPTEARGDRQYTGTRLRQAGGDHLDYDDQGRVVRRQRRTLSGQVRTWHYQWDPDDRLISVTTPTGDHWVYRYDGLGRRIAKQRLDRSGTPVEQTDFTWDGTQLVEQSSTLGGQTTTVTWDWDPDGDRVTTQVVRLSRAPQTEIDERFYAIVGDHLGTPSELVAADGHIAWHAETTLWGQSLPTRQHETYCPLRFPGQYHDAETGLDYNYLRYYDPEHGRYLSPDPLGLVPDVNEYAYVGNPLAWIDPLGLARRKPHFASVTVHDQHGNLKYKYDLESGNQLREEAALGFPNASMASHTEARSMRMHGGSPTVPIPGDPLANRMPVNRGDRVTIHGTKPPCPQCKGAMNRAVSELGVGVTYHWGGNTWQAG